MTNNKYDVRIGQGPELGTLVGVAEQVRMSSVEVEDGPVFLGRVSAVWGFEPSGFEMNAQTARGLGIGRYFWPMVRPIQVALVRPDGARGFIFDRNRGKVAACPSLHLGDDGVWYSLHKE